MDTGSIPRTGCCAALLMSQLLNECAQIGLTKIVSPSRFYAVIACV